MAWKKLTDFCTDLESVSLIQAIRGGLVSIIPVLMIGSFALIVQSLPVPSYQLFLLSPAGTALNNLFGSIYHATFGVMSLYMAGCVGYSLEKNSTYREYKAIGSPIVSVASFLIAVGFLGDSFDLQSLGPSGMFVAIVSSTVTSPMYLQLSARVRTRIFSDGTDPHMNHAVQAIIPTAIVILLFAIAAYDVCRITGKGNLWILVADSFTALFRHVGNDFRGGLLYVFLTNFLWFFGIHGSNVLEVVNIHIFGAAGEANALAYASGLPIPHIYTKTFFDVFTLIGGSGTLLSFLLTLLLTSHRKSSQAHAGIAAFPMLFNINEIMVFGFPIIYTPALFIPFVFTPVFGFLIAAAATEIGLVPPTITTVEWTTPILVGGYQATGSVAGAVLQIIIVVTGTFFYMPFVKLYDQQKIRQGRDTVRELIDIYQMHEARNSDVTLTGYTGRAGATARQLVNDLKSAIDREELFFLYQPQVNAAGTLFGAEALLRWNHPLFGPIYPPLIIRLAAEADILTSLEKYVFLRVLKDTAGLSGITFSVNVTPLTLRDDRFISFLVRTFPDGLAGGLPLCIEVTEQNRLGSGKHMSERLSRLKENGFRLAIDDFSMGHTSLKYLQEGSFDVVKLDGSLSQRVLDDSRTRDIIASIVYLSRSVGFTVLAEYVETTEQMKALADLGCWAYQGYLYSPPVSLESLTKLMARQAVHGLSWMHGEK